MRVVNRGKNKKSEHDRYQYFDDSTVKCLRCGFDKAYMWRDTRLNIDLISCDNCGVYSLGGGPEA